jgi:dolichyl-phosphate beta-glucosyltransferase
MTTNYKLSLIIPVYNAAGFIESSLSQLLAWKNSLDYHTQIILVNDGSTDNTVERINQFLSINRKEQKEIELISYKSNRGKGFAIRKGIAHSLGQYIIFTDADIPFGLHICEKFLHYLSFKEFDLVIGDRRLHESMYSKEIPPGRRLGSSIYTFLTGRFIVGGFFDTQCGIKGFSSKSINKILPILTIDGFAMDVEIIYLSLKQNFDIKRLPVILESKGDSSVNVLKHGPKMVIDIFIIITNQYLGKYRLQKLHQS